MSHEHIAHRCDLCGDLLGETSGPRGMPLLARPVIHTCAVVGWHSCRVCASDSCFDSCSRCVGLLSMYHSETAGSTHALVDVCALPQARTYHPYTDVTCGICQPESMSNIVHGCNLDAAFPAGMYLRLDRAAVTLMCVRLEMKALLRRYLGGDVSLNDMRRSAHALREHYGMGDLEGIEELEEPEDAGAPPAESTEPSLSDWDDVYAEGEPIELAQWCDDPEDWVVSASDEEGEEVEFHAEEQEGENGEVQIVLTALDGTQIIMSLEEEEEGEEGGQVFSELPD